MFIPQVLIFISIRNSTLNVETTPKYILLIRSSLKQCPSRRHANGKSRVSTNISPSEILAGQFVVFTVYALLELPPPNVSMLIFFQKNNLHSNCTIPL